MYLNEKKSIEVFTKLKLDKHKLCVINIFSTCGKRTCFVPDIGT